MSKQKISPDELVACRKRLEEAKTIPHAKSINTLFANVSQDLNAFTDSLKKREEDA